MAELGWGAREEPELIGRQPPRARSPWAGGCTKALMGSFGGRVKRPSPQPGDKGTETQAPLPHLCFPLGRGSLPPHLRERTLQLAPPLEPSRVRGFQAGGLRTPSFGPDSEGK